MGVVVLDRAFAYQTGTVTTSAKSLTDLSFTSDQVGSADSAIITVRTTELLYRLDGGVPTSASHPIAVNETITVQGRQNLLNIKFITASGTSNVTVTLLKRGL